MTTGNRTPAMPEPLPTPVPSGRSAEDPPTYAPGGNSVVLAFLLSIAITSITGALAGLVWGGIGGRIAMRIVFLTSSDHVRGVTSDDGFEIGTISGATVFLLIFATVVGGIAGLAVGVLRMVTAGPAWAVALGTALAAAAAVGATIVHTDGVDFRFLTPLWLTIGLFVLIPGLWGATVILVTDRILRSDDLTRAAPLVHLRYRGAIGWVLLAFLTVVGVRDLIADVAALT